MFWKSFLERHDMLDSDWLKARDEGLGAARRFVEERGLEFLQIELTGLDGLLRGKISPAKKSLSPSGTGISSLTYSLIGNDNVAITPWSNPDNGFPKLAFVPDPDSITAWGWKPGMGSVLHDAYMHDGSVCPIDPRQMVKRLTGELAQRGFEAKMSYELEFYIFHDDDALIQKGDFHALRPFGRAWDAYTLSRSPAWQELGEEFIRRMQSIDIPVEAFHTELGYGMYEFALAPTDPVKAADNAARAKLYLRQLCTERGLIATFMPKWRADRGDSGSGAHFHISLWKDGKPAFWSEEKADLSDVARHALGGLVQTMPDLHGIFRPLVNSYRRMDAASWNPENASWGIDNHSVAIRVINAPTPSHAHFEHRTAGADANPYLVVAALLSGCMEGLDRKIDPGQPCQGDAQGSTAYPLLPPGLQPSIDALAASDMAKRWLGEMFVEQFCQTRAQELADYMAWEKTQISAWELRRYFEWA
ncbi:glutamine synthetase [Rhizorhabdus wittichii DC-6]|nr:glutamine synthetase [Rhizorhabdus wittichii DC-6]